MIQVLLTTLFSPYSNIYFLKVLDLSYNKITKISGLENLLILELNLEGNRLVEINGLSNLPRLSVLNVSNNRIRSLGPLFECMELYNLNIGKNRINKVRQVEFLIQLPWLKYLNMVENSCCSKPRYR